MKEFAPDTTTKYTNEAGKSKQVPAESISQAGGVLVIIESKRRGKGKPGYGITHTLSGASLTGNRLTNDIDVLKKKARRFWKALTPIQRKTWQTQSDVQMIRGSVSSLAVRELY